MEHKKLDQYHKAWGQLHRWIQGGQKAYALPLYRLMSASFENRALAHHLKGDLEITLGQHKQACEAYIQAIEAYETAGKWLQALALCDQLVTIDSSDEHICKWSLLCMTIDDYEVLGCYLKRFCAMVLKRVSTDRVLELIDALQDVNADAQDRLKVQLLLECSASR